jgi:2-succinyl-6-hydroxy-2,4-cyclohexadiene-1-carboxylate synthase
VHSLSYTTSGAGERAVLFLHGFMGNSGDWEKVVGGLGRAFRSVAVDLPGHGRSLGLPKEEYTMEGAANAVLRTLDLLEIHRVSAVGYSMGGRLALYLALRHPERCERLFLESASPGLRSEGERAARRASDEEKAKRLESGDFGRFLDEWYSQPLFATLDERMVESLIERRENNDPRELAKALRGMGTGSQPPLWDELENLSVPALAVAGELDTKFVGIARDMGERGPSASAEVVPGAGHNVHLETPETYFARLEGFLSPS